ncbi:MAG TPA: hypothetical protein VK179_19885 [Bacteroidales bacterium]|nr:hypothetical protein [Bacteroidales bacterium]
MKISIIALGFIILSCGNNKMEHSGISESKIPGNDSEGISIQNGQDQQVNTVLSHTEFEKLTVEVDTNNPFWKKYKEFANPNSNVISFPGNKPLSDFISDNGIKNYDRKFEKPPLVESAFVPYSRTFKSEKWTAVGYTIIYRDEDSSLGCESELTVHNSDGEMCFNLKGIEININEIVVTDDGKYVCFSYGIDDEYGALLNEGYRIYDIGSKKIIAEEKFSGQYYNVHPGSMHNNIKIGMLKDGPNSFYVIYDFRNSTRYKYEYLPGPDKQLVKITEGGFVFKANGIFDTLLFKNIAVKETF